MNGLPQDQFGRQSNSEKKPRMLLRQVDKVNGREDGDLCYRL